MPYKERIKSLTNANHLLDEQIQHLERLSADPMRITELRQRQVMFKEEITRLYKLQYEEDNDRVYFDDER